MQDKKFKSRKLNDTMSLYRGMIIDKCGDKYRGEYCVSHRHYFFYLSQAKEYIDTLCNEHNVESLMTKEQENNTIAHYKG